MRFLPAQTVDNKGPTEKVYATCETCLSVQTCRTGFQTWRRGSVRPRRNAYSPSSGRSPAREPLPARRGLYAPPRALAEERRRAGR